MTASDLNEIRAQMPASIKEAVARFGFHKLAAKVYGVEAITEKVAVTIIGTKLATRLADNRTIRQGLASLATFR